MGEIVTTLSKELVADLFQGQALLIMGPHQPGITIHLFTR